MPEAVAPFMRPHDLGKAKWGKSLKLGDILSAEERLLCSDAEMMLRFSSN